MIGGDAADELDELDDDELDELDELDTLGGFIHPINIPKEVLAFVISSFVSGLAEGELSLFSSSPAAAAAGLRPFGDFDLGLAGLFAGDFALEPVPCLGGIYSSPYKNILLILS